MEHSNPFASDIRACPYPAYADWRDGSQVVWSDEAHAWMVLGHEEATRVLREHETFSSTNSVFGGPEAVHPEFPSIINTDDPEHRSLRLLVASAFTPRTVDADWEPRVREVVRGLLDDVERKGSFDVVHDLAAPLPVIMIAEVIGVPSDRFREFKKWSDAAAAFIGRLDQLERLYDPTLTDEDRFALRYEGFDNALGEFFHAELERRREQPSDDLMTRLVEAEIEGERLSGTQIVAFCTLLLIAGNETTTNLIAQAIRALVEHPNQQQMVREDPALCERLVEETLRWEAPIQSFYRRATHDVELGGQSIKRGDALLVIYGSANRDPAKYECPAEFDVTRGSRDHLAFSTGIHSCLGANLARLESRVAVEEVLARFPSLEPVEGYEPEWRDTPFFRGPLEYRVRINGGT